MASSESVPLYHGRSGFKDIDKFIGELQSAINDEASAIEFYTSLEQMVPEEDRDFIEHASRDEMVHLRLLRRLYKRLTGVQARVQAAQIPFASYREGLYGAFLRELDAAERYRDMYLSTRILKVRDVLFRTMTDEMEHAQRFSFLYSKGVPATTSAAAL